MKLSQRRRWPSEDKTITKEPELLERHKLQDQTMLERHWLPRSVLGASLFCSLSLCSEELCQYWKHGIAIKMKPFRVH
jgi:hypothetical protein